MTYVLDTNIISYALNGNAAITAKIKAVTSLGDTAIIPLIVYYEVRRGLISSGATTKARAFDVLCDKLNIPALTVSDMETAADIYAERKRQGTPIDDADLLIAAQAITNGYTLITHNIRHFENISGLTVEDWTK
jgi:tRNA(fMet)-specific endonuclease VapC